MTGILAVTPLSLVIDLVRVVFALAGVVTACAALYLVLLAFASFGRRPRRGGATPRAGSPCWCRHTTRRSS